MYLGKILGGASSGFDVLQDCAMIGLKVQIKPDEVLTSQEILRKINVTAEIVSSDARQGKILFRKVPLIVLSALVNFGAAFNQIFERDGSRYICVNVPVCLSGAIAFDKSKYLRFDLSSELVNTTQIHVYTIGSTVTGTDPLRISYNKYLANEQSKIGLSGSSHICFERDHIDKVRYNSVLGRTLDLIEDENVFVENTFGDLFIASKSDIRTETLLPFIVMPTSTSVSAELEISDKGAEIWTLFSRYDDSLVDGCHC